MYMQGFSTLNSIGQAMAGHTFLWAWLIVVIEKCIIYTSLLNYTVVRCTLEITVKIYQTLCLCSESGDRPGWELLQTANSRSCIYQLLFVFAHCMIACCDACAIVPPAHNDHARFRRKYWSGHGLTGRSGSYAPDIYMYMCTCVHVYMCTCTCTMNGDS